MDRRLWLLLGIAWAGFVSGAAAEPIRSNGVRPPTPADEQASHRLLGDLLDPFSAEDILNDRLQEALDKEKRHELKSLFEDKELLKRLTKDRLTPEQLRLLDANSDKVSDLLRDPRFLSLMEQSKAAAKQQGGALTEQQIDAFKKLAESHLDPAALPSDANGAGAAASGDQSESKPDGQPQNGGPEQEAKQAEQLTGDQIKESWFERQINRFTTSMMESVSDPDNAGAFERALRSLGGLKTEKDGTDRLDVSALWKSASDDAATWITSHWEWPSKVADVSGAFYRDMKKRIPTLSGTVGNALSNLPAGPATSSNSGGEIATGAGIAGTILLLVIGWKSWRRRGFTRQGSAAVNAGPWPVNPRSVGNGDELILAFEHLAILRLGGPASTCNHREIAVRLGDGDSDGAHRAAADELARLYERVRYEPNPLPLAESDLTAARRDLTLLAGVAGA
jgi:hypothetical protein